MTMNEFKRGAVRLSLLGGLAAGLLAVAPGVGHAAAGEPTVTRAGATVTITASSIAKNDNITLQSVSGRLHVFGQVVAPAGSGCQRVSANEVNCGDGVTTVNADLGGGNDRFSSLVGIGGTIKGGGDDDTFLAGRGLNGTSFVYQGGSGSDTVDYGSSGQPVTVTKDNSARSDGRSIDRDDVTRDVETVEGTIGADTLIGSDVFDRLIGGEGADTLEGKGGDDIIDATDRQGTKDTVIDCGNGNDNATVDAADAPRACETVSRP
jgi:Ca2+-binding RTX toxin-like protein